MVFLKESFEPTMIQQEMLVSCDFYFTYRLVNDIKQLALCVCESACLYERVYVYMYVCILNDFSIVSLLHRIFRAEWN
jgi:hypothetical protein